MIKRLVRASVRTGLRSPRLRRLVAAELATSPAPVSAPATTRSPIEERVFVDRHGVAHPLDPGLRDKLKPAWRTMLDPVAVAAPPTDDALRAGARKATRVVDEAARLVATVTGASLEGTILEVGCYDGAAAYELARVETRRVVASDMARYYVAPNTAGSADDELEAQKGRLAALRERARVIAGIDPGRVTFVEDDITTSTLEPATFDAIVSFEVLEHVDRPTETFATMARLLKPGGIAYHDYNPFFSLIGGHSLCALDFAWGHARLDPGDFERYVREIRPDEERLALGFYRDSLNRLTLADLRVAIADTALEPLAIIPWFDRTLVPQLTPDILAEVRRTYPTVEVEDLLATFVAVIVRRPLDPGPVG